MLWAWKDHDETGHHDQKLDSIIGSGNEYRPPCVSFAVPLFDIVIFKVQPAWVYADTYAE